jgi:D-alanyl-D-alanine carboxypeptidase
MRFPMLTILTCFVMLFVFVLSFGLANSKIFVEDTLPNAIENVKGRVLGATEEIKNLSLSQLPQVLQARGKLPESTDKPEEEEIEPFNLQANCGSVLDLQNRKILFNKDADKEWPIASITKLVTALVFLEHNPGWDTIYEVRRGDRREGGKIFLYTGEKVKVKDLFYLSLVGSANTATIGLVHSTGMTEQEFVQKMNEKAGALGLKNTRFHDPVGLNNYNISTAREIAKFTRTALSDKDISEATLTKKYEFTTLEGKKKVVYNTDDLLNIFPQNGIRIIGGKTGYNISAGYCFVGKFIDHDGREMISVVLGSDSRDLRFSETRDLVEWTYDTFIW